MSTQHEQTKIRRTVAPHSPRHMALTALMVREANPRDLVAAINAQRSARLLYPQSLQTLRATALESLADLGAIVEHEGTYSITGHGVNALRALDAGLRWPSAPEDDAKPSARRARAPQTTHDATADLPPGAGLWAWRPNSGSRTAPAAIMGTTLPPTLRPGAEDWRQWPSRIGNLLVYRDGRRVPVEGA